MEKHTGKHFILKYYRRENAVKPEVIAKLRSISSPYVAPVSDYGEFQGHQYTVRPHYEMPALSDVLTSGTRFSEEELKSFIIPSVIEGLKVVHDARKQGVDVGNGCCYWWLRSPGCGQHYATVVDSDGAVNLYGNCVYSDDYAVRPALRIICNL